MPHRGSFLERMSTWATHKSGSSWAFAIASAIVLIWFATGPIFDYSNTWQLVINTGTTIVTFLMVFLIQRGQNKESMAIQLKLNELVASMRGASNRLINVEDLTEEEVRILHGHYAKLVELAKQDLEMTISHSIEDAEGDHARKLEEWRRSRKSETQAAHIARPLLVLIVVLSGGTAVGAGQDKLPTPEEQYKTLLKESNRATGSGAVMTDAERLKFVGAAYKHRYEMAPKFLKLAEKYPYDPIALDALTQAVWQVNTTPWPVEMVGEDPARAKAFELIQRDHIRSEKLGPMCLRVSYGFASEYETFLRAVVEKNPHKPVQAAASVSLAHFLNNRLARVDLCREQPQLAKEFEGLYGKEYFAELRKQSRDKAIREIETAFEQAAEKYGDVKLPAGDTVGERAKAELFEIRNLSVGKEAPDIKGEDQDGKQFKLSEYRGKVVLLDFWSFV